MGCSCSQFTDYLAGDQSTIVVNGLLDANTNYVWELTDGFGNQYNIPFTTNNDGLGTIDTTQLPEGFCNPYQQPVKIKVKKLSTSCTYEALTMIQKVDCMVISFENSNVTKGYIGCSIDVGSLPTSPLPLTFKIKTDPDAEATPVEKPTGNTLQENSLIGKTPWPFIIIDNTPLQWAEAGITFNSTTGTFDFTAYNPLVDGMTINIPYYEI